MPPLPSVIQEVAVTSMNGIVYVAAGSASQMRTNALWSFDPGTQTWTRLAPYPGTALDHTALVPLGGFLYLIGGAALCGAAIVGINATRRGKELEGAHGRERERVVLGLRRLALQRHPRTDSGASRGAQPRRQPRRLGRLDPARLGLLLAGE